ncbi:MAG: glycosyltransferase [Cyanobacteria bacterium J06554_6]
MPVSFHVATASAALPIDAQTYVVEAPSGRLYVDKLTAAACAQLNDTYPVALTWHDLIYTRGRKGHIYAQRLQWPKLDQRLLPSVSHAGRCAIRADRLQQLYQDGLIDSPRNTSQALTQLVATGEPIGELAGVLRFTGWQDAPAYAPLAHPKPAQTARSISIIINYRDRPDLMAVCLQSIQQQTATARLEVILIDNQSEPQNRTAVEQQIATWLPAPITVQHLRYDAPFDHSAQTNLGASQATGEVLVMFNNDARFIAPGTLQTLADWALTPQVATVGPRVIGNQQRLVASGIQVYSATAKRPAGLCESTVAPLSRTVRGAAGNSFACCAIARQVWDALGGLKSDRFPTQYNDADYCLRALSQGFRHIYIGTSTIYHEPGQSEVRTRASTSDKHAQLLNYHPNIDRFTKHSPELIRLRLSPADVVWNPTPQLRLFERYRKLRQTADRLVDIFRSR